MKIAVDFDGTLELESVQNYVKKLINSGHVVEIVTTRWDEKNKFRYAFFRSMDKKSQDELHKDIYDVAKKLNIPYNFTNFEYKAKFLNDNHFEMLIDDNPKEKEHLKKVNKNIIFQSVDNLETDEE